MKIIRQLFYLLTILVITVEASTLILNGDVQLVYVSTTKQIADGLTKALSNTLH